MKKQKRLLFIGDSLALPREGVPYEATCISKLKKRFPDFDFIPVLKRGITTNVLVEWGGGGNENNKEADEYPYGSDCLEFYKPNIVVLLLGIVDCAPRLLKNGIEKSLVSRLPKNLALKYIKLIKKYRKRKHSNTLVPPFKFKNNLINYFDRCSKIKVEKVIIIKIPLPTSEMVSLNPKIIDNVILYNEIFDSMAIKYPFVKCVDPLDPKNSAKRIYTDGYHPNIDGNDLVFQYVEKEIL